MDFIGVWSTNQFEEVEGPGENILTFREDGTGRSDFGNHGYYNSTTFRWSCPSEGRLSVGGVHFFSFSFFKPLHDLCDSPLSYSDVPFRVTTETTRRNRVIPVFHAALFDMPEDVGFGLETRMLEEFTLEKRLLELGAPR